MAQRRFATFIRPKFMVFTILLLCVSYIIFQIYVNPPILSIITENGNSTISSGCSCQDESTGIDYDFCYKYSTLTKTAIGRRFSCEYLPILKSFDLLDDSDNFNTLNNRFPSNFDSVIFITAASQSHFEEEYVLIQSIQKYFSTRQRVIFYDLGLNTTNIKEIRRLCGVEYRLFPFEKYPEYVRRLYEFRWKPIIIAEALKEFGAIWYMDSSITFERGDLSDIYALFECQKSQLNVTSTTIRSNLNLLVRKKKKKCEKFPYMLHGAAGHGIFSVTSPDVYNYIPTDLNRLKEKACNMFEAGFAFIVRTSDVVRHIVKWYVLCALERNCMGPRGSSGGCEFNAVDRFGKYARCHRFDQSVLNLLLANHLDFDSKYWSSGIYNLYFNIRREQSLPQENKSSLRYC